MNNFYQFIEHISQYDQQIALVRLSDNTSLTYQQLVTETCSLANFLASKIKPGDRVVLAGITDLDWVKSFLAIILAKGIVVPVDDRVSEDLLLKIVALTSPTVILKKSTKFLPATISSSCSVLNLDELQIPDRPTLSPILQSIDPSQVCQIVFTSGTWSVPKGVSLTQTNILSNLQELVLNVYQTKSGKKFLSILPLEHAYEQMCGLLISLYFGSQIGYLKSITPKKFSQALQNFQPNYIVLVPRVLEMMQKSILGKLKKFYTKNLFQQAVKLVKFMPISFRRFIFHQIHQGLGSNLEAIFVGGAFLDPHLDSFFQGLGFKTYVGYGMSEASPLIAASRNQNRKPGEVGKFLGNLDWKLNEHSEILLKGPSIFAGYWPNLTQKPTEYFNTKDIGELTPNGTLILKGRSKNLIIYPSGDKIFGEDVEHLANQLPEVAESCLVNLDPKNPRLVLVIASHLDNQGLDLEGLKTRICQDLPLFVYVSKVLLYPHALPKTHTLKINRQQIQDWTVLNSD